MHCTLRLNALCSEAHLLSDSNLTIICGTEQNAHFIPEIFHGHVSMYSDSEQSALQLNLIEGYKLVVDKIGSGKSTRLRILPEYLPLTTGGRSSDGHVAESEPLDGSGASTNDVTGDADLQERVTDGGSASSVIKIAAVSGTASSEIILSGDVESISLRDRLDSLPAVGTSGAETGGVSSQLTEDRRGVYLVKEAAEYAKTSWQKENAFMEGYQSSGRLARNGKREGRDQKFKRTRQIVDEEYDEAEPL